MYTYLIVDDEMIERKGIRMLLSRMNIRENILEASNGEEALEAFASFITKRDSTSLEVEDGWYRWQVTIPADVLSERAADQKIGEITGIEVRRRSEGGAAETVRIEGEKGSMEIEGEYQIRKFLSAKGWPIQKNDGTVSCEMELLPSACFIVVPEKEGETAVSFTFYGGG